MKSTKNDNEHYCVIYECINLTKRNYCIIEFTRSDNNRMNNLYDLYVAHLGERNIYEEVREFQNRECHSANFQTIMNWLKELIKLSEIAHRNKVIADLNIKTTTKAVKIKAKTKYCECRSLKCWNALMR